MIQIEQTDLYNLMKKQEIVGARIYDMEDNLIFVYVPESMQKSKPMILNVINLVKEFSKSVSALCIIRLKKYGNTRPEDELVYKVRLGHIESDQISKPLQGTAPGINIEDQIEKGVQREMVRIEKEKEVETLKAEIERLNKPMGRAEKIMGMGIDRLIQGVGNYMEKAGMTAPNLQGAEDIEEAVEVPDKGEMDEDDMFDQAVQILFDHGVSGEFLLALAHKVKEKPSLITTIQKLLDLPKLKNNGKDKN